MNLRRAVLGDEAILRDLRLQALADAPDAFGSTYQRELERTMVDWQRWLSPGVTFLVEANDQACGIVAGGRDLADPSAVNLMAMWIHPTMRGVGAGDLLVGAVVSWAEAEGARAVRLEVVKNNVRAQRCYERNGFRPTGRELVRERDGQIQIEMERPVSRQL